MAAFSSSEKVEQRQGLPYVAPGSESPTLPNGRRVANATPAGSPSALGRVENVPGYELLAELGRGGMGVVYQARQVKANRLVALKMILAGEHASEIDLSRFRLEAEAVAHIQHPNVVQIFEVGEHRGKPFFSLEFCEGGGLDRKLNGTPLPPREAAVLVEKLARAIQAAHEKGVIHRDLKPGTVLFTVTGEPKVTDFGLAKRLNAEGHTMTGVIMGTPSYMSPEQATGRKDVGPAADIYALGAILYDCLTGRPPFKAASAFDTIAQVLEDEPVPISRLIAKTPRDLETICSKCLEKSPSKRYASAGAMADDLARFLRGEAILARPVGRLERAGKWIRRNPAVASLTATTVLALLVGASVALGLAVYAWEQADDAKTSASEARSETKRADLAAADATARAAESARLAKEARQAEDDARAKENLLKRSRHAMRLMLSLQAWQSSDIVRARSILGESEPEFRGTWEEWFVRALCVRRDPLFTLSEATCGPLAMTADGDWIASAGHDRRIRIWDARTGRMKVLLTGHTQQIQGLAISADGKKVVSGAGSVGKPGEVKVWDGTTGKILFTCDGQADRVTSVAISANGKRFVSGSWDKTVRLWDAETGKPKATFEGIDRAIGCVAMSADGKRIAATSSFGEVKVWDAETQQVISSFAVRKPGITSMAMSANAKLLVICFENTPTVWDAQTGQEKVTLRGHVGHIHRVAMSADGQRIVSAGADRTVRVWSVQTGLELLRFEGNQDEVLGVAVSADGQHIVSGGQDAPMRIWSAKTGQDRLELTGHTNAVYRVAFAARGKRIVTGSFDNSVKIWDSETGRKLLDLRGHTNRIYGMAVSADGKLIVTASADTTLKVWDAFTGKERITLPGHPGGPTCVDFSPDGKQVVSGSWDKSVKVWDVQTGELKYTFTCHTGSVASVSWSPDGKHIASGSWDKSLLVWDARTRKVVHSLGGHSGAITSIQWSPSGKSIASASADRTSRVWNFATGKVQHVLTGHADEVNGLAWSPNGKRLASVSHDKTVKIWDTETGQFKLTLEGHKAQVWGVAWSPDGHHIVSGAWDNTAKVWSAEPCREVPPPPPPFALPGITPVLR